MVFFKIRQKIMALFENFPLKNKKQWMGCLLTIGREKKVKVEDDKYIIKVPYQSGSTSMSFYLSCIVHVMNCH